MILYSITDSSQVCSSSTYDVKITPAWSVDVTSRRTSINSKFELATANIPFRTNVLHPLAKTWVPLLSLTVGASTAVQTTAFNTKRQHVAVSD